MSDEHPFQPGVEVAIVTRNYSGTSYTLGKVAKVYKTGRFILKRRGDQQYRASRGWHDKAWEARATGSSYGSHARVERGHEMLARLERVRKIFR